MTNYLHTWMAFRAGERKGIAMYVCDEYHDYVTNEHHVDLMLNNEVEAVCVNVDDLEPCQYIGFSFPNERLAKAYANEASKRTNTEVEVDKPNAHGIYMVWAYLPESSMEFMEGYGKGLCEGYQNDPDEGDGTSKTQTNDTDTNEAGADYDVTYITYHANPYDLREDGRVTVEVEGSTMDERIENMRIRFSEWTKSGSADLVSIAILNEVRGKNERHLYTMVGTTQEDAERFSLKGDEYLDLRMILVTLDYWNGQDRSYVAGEGKYWYIQGISMAEHFVHAWIEDRPNQIKKGRLIPVFATVHDSVVINTVLEEEQYAIKAGLQGDRYAVKKYYVMERRGYFWECVDDGRTFTRREADRFMRTERKSYCSYKKEYIETVYE